VIRIRTLSLAALLLAAATLAAQTPPQLPKPVPIQLTPQSPTPAQLPDSPGVVIQPKPAPVPTGPTALFDTTAGRLTCKFFEHEAPIATASFIGLAEGTKDWTDPATGQKIHGKPFYDGTTFHRVIPGFMIQGGDPTGNGTGDAGFFFENEVVPGLTFSVPGRLAMANAGPNTNGSQFFITETAVPDLDGKYTIFGQCDTHSVLLVATIARADRNARDKPITPVLLNKVTIVRPGQPIPPEPPPPPPPLAIPAMPPPL